VTVTGVPLVKASEVVPPVSRPVPPVNTAVKLELPPAVIVAGLAAKLVIVGTTGVTVTVAVEVTVGPPEPLTVSVYVVVVVGLTETAEPLVAEMVPGVITPVPLENTPVRLELVPETIEAGLAVKLLMAGGLVLPPPPPPLLPPPHPPRVIIPSPETAATAARTILLFVMASSKLEINRFQCSPVFSKERERYSMQCMQATQVYTANNTAGVRNYGAVFLLAVERVASLIWSRKTLPSIEDPGRNRRRA